MTLQQALEQSRKQIAEAYFDGYTTIVNQVEADDFVVSRQFGGMTPFFQEHAANLVEVAQVLASNTPHRADEDCWTPDNSEEE